MKDWYVFGIDGQAAVPLALCAAIFIMGLVWLGCQKPQDPLLSVANAGAPGASGAAAAAPASPATAAPASATGQPDTPANAEIALLAGGCFWGMEEILRQIPGVIDVEAGYTGGSTPNPTYRDMHSGLTGHAEAVRVTFDPSRISYADLLEKWFFRMHDPTTKNRQGNDIGSQYRSAIFATTAQQRATAEQVKTRVDASGFWDDPIVTQVADAGPFTLAEEEHQNYLQKYPDGYTCHFMRK